MAVSIVIAGYFGFNPPDFAAGTVALAFGLAASSIFATSMFSKDKDELRVDEDGDSADSDDSDG